MHANPLYIHSPHLGLWIGHLQLFLWVIWAAWLNGAQPGDNLESSVWVVLILGMTYAMTRKTQYYNHNTVLLMGTIHLDEVAAAREISCT